MIWRTDKPDTIGDYIVIIPEVISPIGEFSFPQKITGAVTRAWFDGERFNFMKRGFYTHIYDAGCEVGQCVWTPDPIIEFSGFGPDGPILEVRE